MKSAFALDSAELWNRWLIEIDWGERILLFAFTKSSKNFLVLQNYPFWLIGVGKIRRTLLFAKAKRSKNFYMVALRADFFVDSSLTAFRLSNDRVDCHDSQANLAMTEKLGESL